MRTRWRTFCSWDDWRIEGKCARKGAGFCVQIYFSNRLQDQKKFFSFVCFCSFYSFFILGFVALFVLFVSSWTFRVSYREREASTQRQKDDLTTSHGHTGRGGKNQCSVSRCRHRNCRESTLDTHRKTPGREHSALRFRLRTRVQDVPQTRG
jgi:hypothetical protein